MTTPAESQTPAAPEGQQQTAEKPPPWGDSEFDAERAWKKIQALEADKEKLAKRPVLDAATKAKLEEFDRLKAASQTDLEKAQGELSRWQSEAETWRSNAVGATVKAFAAADFADPDDAVRNLDPAKYLDAGGAIDERAIQADLAALLDAKPHYRRGDGTPPGPRAPKPNGNQGSGVNGRSAPNPAQEFAAILQSRMT